MSPQELVSTLIAQHRVLQADLSTALKDTSQNENGANDIVLQLTKFRSDLSEHIKLENGVFYPDYLAKKKNKGEDTTDTEEFIKQMVEIGKTVTAFLDKYATVESINSAGVAFGNDLQGIISALNIRIESEEEGVYGLYLIF